jgi:hypothetical protein
MLITDHITANTNISPDTIAVKDIFNGSKLIKKNQINIKIKIKIAIISLITLGLFLNIIPPIHYTNPINKAPTTEITNVIK